MRQAAVDRGCIDPDWSAGRAPAGCVLDAYNAAALNRAMSA
jgi:hypothetical protein